MKKQHFIPFCLSVCMCAVVLTLSGPGIALGASKGRQKAVLQAAAFKHYVDYFNRMEDENIRKAVPNEKAWEWMKSNIPLFECPQDNFEEIYYYRWWTFRKHLTETPQGYGITEFMVNRFYADRYNLISCALGHHIMESRWLHNPVYLQDDVRIWFRGNNGQRMSKLMKFSSWTAYALYNSYLVNADKAFLTDMFPDLLEEYRQWEKEKRTESGLFWQYDVRDGMEEQISGGRKVKNLRPTINSYMYGNAVALSAIAALKGDEKLSACYSMKADTLKQLVESSLWDPDDQFYETMQEAGGSAKVREAIGFIPWYFDLPGENRSVAWKQLMDPDGFLAPFGITTAERRHPDFRMHGCCSCEWDGAIWPFATSQTLTGMANLLNHYHQDYVDRQDYFRQLELYVESQYYRGRPYIGEYLDETTGYWLKGDQERSRYYNHSTFNDLVITGLVGLCPRADELIEVNPLIPENQWDWFCLDNVLYHGRILTIIWDRTGEKYEKGQGLAVYVDGREAGRSAKLERLICR
ncbi:MAG: glycosyl hydrolase family 65 protein [Mangrovibacterium sp.]